MKWSFDFFPKRRTWRCRRLDARQSITDRQQRLRGWNQAAYARANVLLVGCGANSLVGWACARKGIGRIDAADMDVVDDTNLHRQLFYRSNRYRNKALELCRNLSREGFCGTELVAHPCSVQELDLEAIHPSVVCCAVDMQIVGTRLDVCRACHEREIPCVFFALSADADRGYVFVQEPGKACWACALKPEQLPAEQAAGVPTCPGTPASVDVVMALASLALYAIDSIIMTRPRDWNYRMLSLSTADFGGGRLVAPRPDCPVCGGNLPPSAHDAKESP